MSEMSIIFKDIVDKTVYPVKIRNGGKEYLTLYYYTVKDDALLHDPTHLICFRDDGALTKFCADNGLKLEQETYTFDFDLSIANPANYKELLHQWNLLNTISNIFGRYFEGKSKKYDSLYDLLFRYYTSVAPLSSAATLSEKDKTRLARVFQKKDRLLGFFKLYEGEAN